jgi:hypothetical protein
VAYRSSTSGTGTSTTLATTVPAGVQADDIVLLATTFDSNTASFSGKWPTGFTQLANGNLTADGQAYGLAWKRLTGADSGSYTLSALTGEGAAGWVCQAFAFSGRDTGNPPVNSTPATSNAANTSPVTIAANGVTALAGDDLCWLSYPDVSATGIGNGHTPPAGYTERQDAELGFSNLSGATQDNVSAGATGSVSGTFALTSGTSGWAAILVRIPAGAASTKAPPPYRRGRRWFRTMGGILLPAAGLGV